MRVFVAGASGAIGTPARPAARRARPRRRRHAPARRRRPTRLRGAGRGAGRARRCSTARAVRAAGRRGRPGRDRPPGDRAHRPDRPQALRPRVRARPTACAPRVPTTCSQPRATSVSRRFVAQSFTGWPYAREGGPVKTEDDPLDPTPVAAMRETLDAIRHLEQAVVGRRRDRAPLRRLLRLARRTAQLELVASGGSRSSATAAGSGRSSTSTTPPRRPSLALEQGAPGIYNVVDDDPAPVASGCRRWPRRSAPSRRATSRAGSPACWRARPAVALMTEIRGASNAKAKRELGWTLRHPSWRQGFPAAYSPGAA